MNTTKTWFGHPRGLATLFFTEMWERFSYYGMRAILVFALVDAVGHGGQGLTDREADAIYGLYISGIYVFSLAGGWLSDRIFGQQRAVLIGGVIIALGHFTMAMPYTVTFYTGMLIIVLGTGLFKPTMSSLVGLLYSKDTSARRDAGFSIFYMGINVGAFIGQILVGYLGENVGWHYGFAAAGIFMLLGLIQFKLTSHYLGGAGAPPHSNKDDQQYIRIRRQTLRVVVLLAVLVAALVAMIKVGWLQISGVTLATYYSYVVGGITLLYFISVLLFGGLTVAERRRVLVIMVMVFTAAFFWAGFEQTGSSMNLFAQRYTDRIFFGWEIPASWLQSVNSFFVITLAPVLASLWLRLGAKRIDPSMPMKFGLGLIQLGLGFLVLVFASQFVVRGEQIAPTWLVVTYLLHSTGELCLSPVGLSTVTKLAPARYAAQMMGTWFMANALGNVISGLLAGHLGGDAVNEMPYRFLMVFVCTAGVGLLLLLFAKWINQLSNSETS